MRQAKRPIGYAIAIGLVAVMMVPQAAAATTGNGFIDATATYMPVRVGFVTPTAGFMGLEAFVQVDGLYNGAPFLGLWEPCVGGGFRVGDATIDVISDFGLFCDVGAEILCFPMPGDCPTPHIWAMAGIRVGNAVLLTGTFNDPTNPNAATCLGNHVFTAADMFGFTAGRFQLGCSII